MSDEAQSVLAVRILEAFNMCSLQEDGHLRLQRELPQGCRFRPSVFFFNLQHRYFLIELSIYLFVY